MSLFGRRERREIRELNAYADRLRAQRDKAVRGEETAVFNRRQISEQYAALDEKYIAVRIINNCLTEDLTAAAARIAEYGIRRTVPEVLEEHDVHRKALADALGEQKYHLNWGQLTAEVARLHESAIAWMADHAAEKLRADHLQQCLDQVLGLDDAAVALGASWQARRQKRMQFDKPTVEETTP